MSVEDDPLDERALFLPLSAQEELQEVLKLPSACSGQEGFPHDISRVPCTTLHHHAPCDIMSEAAHTLQAASLSWLQAVVAVLFGSIEWPGILIDTFFSSS